MILYKFIRHKFPHQDQVELKTFEVLNDTKHCWRIRSLAGYHQMVQKHSEKKYAAPTIDEAWEIFEDSVRLAIKNAEQIVFKCSCALENGNKAYEEAKKAERLYSLPQEGEGRG